MNGITNENNPNASIILPVYNDEKNLPNCINSILCQTFKNFECLLINDGSDDSCPALCDEYARKNSRIRVFHKKNEGVSKTRQFGIDNAAGEYIYFVDSDDWIEPSFLENTLKASEDLEPDILFFDFYEDASAEKKRYYSQNPGDLNPESIALQILRGRLFSCLWNVAIKKDFCKKCNVQFKEGINYGEDTLFILELLFNNPRIGYLPAAFYHHSRNKESFTRKNQKQKYLERIAFLNYLPVLLEKYNKTGLLKYNFFPLNDKYEMLCSGVFSKDEYKKLYPVSSVSSCVNREEFPKYLLLLVSETFLYSLTLHLSRFLRKFKEFVYLKRK